MAKQRYGNELHPLYARWLSTTQRCLNPNHASYKNYGARGLTMAEDLRSFKEYVAYVTSLPNYGLEKGSLDRVDNSVGYEKGNLRWVCSSIQLANRRFSGKGSTTYTGVEWNTHHKRWVARINFKGKTVFSKVCRSEEEALNARNAYIVVNNLPHTVQPFK